MQKQKKEKERFKGLFICNERQKRNGGRIKCVDIPNKIEIYGKNQAIHESEVEWIQIRRYKRQNRKPNIQPQKKQINSKIKTNQEGLKKKQQIHSTDKQKQTSQIQGKNQHNTKKHQEYKQKQEVKLEKQQDKGQKETSKKKKYKLKDVSKQETSQIKGSIELKSQLSDSVASQVYQNESSVSKETKTSKQNENQVKQKRQIDQDTERKQENDDDKSNESDDEQKKQDLQIIVGQIVKQTNIIYKTKPFVAILNFQKKNASKRKEKKKYDNPIEQLLSDFYVDIVPIHLRLPIMEMDQYIKQNNQILLDYVNKVVKYDEKKKRTDELNRIIDSLSNTYIFVTFSDWDGDFPLAKIHKILGKAMTIEGECERFLYEHGLNDFHYEESSTEKVQQIEIKPRKIHKKLDRMVFTIDPPTSTDLDDALSIESIGNHYEIGIHIADVSSYLDDIDRNQLIRRTTSVYLPYKVYHMLERHLVKVCSLDPKCTRLAFTVWVTMDLEGNIIGQSRLQKNIIESRFKLSYEVVQNILTGKLSYEDFNKKYQSTEEQYELLISKLLKLSQIAQQHRKQRVLFDVFENQELQFIVDQQSWPVSCHINKRYTAKKMVEQFMIIGNVQSARILVKYQPLNALVIHHPKPSKLAFNSFVQQFKMLQMKWKFQNVQDVQRQLLQLQNNKQVKDQIKKICYFRARRIMEPAIYRKYNQIIQQQNKEKQKLGQKLKEKQKNMKQLKEINKNEIQSKPQDPIIHFALGLQFYTHFTSPMRRMADILVHQVLTKVLEGEKSFPIQKSQIEKINLGRRSTKRLKKDLNQVYLCLMIYHTKNPIKTQGIISSFGLESVSIYIPLFDMQKQVLWKKQFKIHSIKRIRNKDDRLDVKIKHDKKSAKGDVFWVMKKFQKVQLTLNCTKNPPLKLTIEMEVESEKGPYNIEWIQY